MKDLIKINLNENQEPIVDGRDLYEALGVESNYTTWFNRMCEYGFIEGADYIVCFPNLESEKHGGQNKINHALKLDMAKEIAMIQRNETGKKIRQYFIQVEKDFNNPEKIMARALKIAENKINVLLLESAEYKKIIEAQKPKVLFADSVTATKECIEINVLAKELTQNGLKIGDYKLRKKFKKDHYFTSKGMPTQKAMEMGLFQIETRYRTDKKTGRCISYEVVLVTRKGQQYFIEKYAPEKNIQQRMKGWELFKRKDFENGEQKV